jgi:amino acid adenylation domain-containing protein
VEELQPERSLSHHPLFQVMFALQQSLESRLGGAAGPIDDDPGLLTGTSKFDLMMSLAEAGDTLVGTLEYNTDLFDAATIERMAGHWHRLLEGLLQDPVEPVWAVPLLTNAERRQLLVGWNQTHKAFPANRCVHQLFEEQAARTPDAPAVSFDREQLSYRDLDQRANQLANYLCSLGIGPESRVGICLERSLQMVVGMVGILKAGGAHTPLDPAYPADRLAFMAKDARMDVVLTEQKLLDRLPPISAQVVCLDRDWPEISVYGTASPDQNVHPDNLAYVIYTSGSTGRPKGVGVSHASHVNLLEWQRTNTSTSAQSPTLQFMSFSFDVSFHEVFATLSTGGTIVMLPEAIRKDMSATLGLMTGKRVERVFLPAPAVDHLAEIILEQDIADLRIKEIVSTGEQLRVTASVAALFATYRECVLDNQYGPTETHFVTSHKLTGAAESWPFLPPIGRPIANCTVYLLDERLTPVPVGVPGELYTAGACLARGYLDRPDLTAEKFIPCPFSDEPGARMYRTGDMARYLPDGVIQYLGRRDDQVKIRGFRVELGEIEAVLAQHPDVKQSAVVVHTGTSGSQRLVAYLVLAGTGRTDGLRPFVQQKLPDFMVPTSFVAMDALPLAANGKIDRLMLQRTGLESTPAPNRDEVRTPGEESIVSIFADVLGLKDVGKHDNFFDLGGHSLLATKAVLRIRSAFNLDIPLRMLFEYPAAHDLANAIASQADLYGNEALSETGDFQDRNLVSP